MDRVLCTAEPGIESEQPSCPRCGATLLPLPGQLRCTRCQFTLCRDCESSLEES